MKASPTEYIFPLILSAGLALVGATAGFVGGVLMCARLPGEYGEWGLISGPALALLLGAATFIFSMRKLL
ncbi:MAG TPA: hypothetical protein VHZ09_18675 [Acidobacteriaceae bacterium]|jgi:hypothetical protein|nr:hypothetical protein [Acidobacteriaceae bacterium]